MKYLTYVFLAGLMLLVVGCGTWMEDFDVEATVEARIASIPTPQIVIVEVEKEVVKEVEVEVEVPIYLTVEVEKIVEVEVDVEKIVEVEVEVEKIVVVIATVTPIPTPRPTVTPRPTPTPEPYRYEGVVFTWDESPENLPYELETDIDVAKRKYLNAYLTVTGEVYDIIPKGTLDMYGDEFRSTVLRFAVYVYKGALKPAVWEELYCYFDDEEEVQDPVSPNSKEEISTSKQVSGLESGDNVTVRGWAYLLRYGQIYLESCSIVD